MCVIETESTHTFDRRILVANEEERLVWRAGQRHISGQGWVWVGEWVGRADGAGASWENGAPNERRVSALKP